MSSSFDQYDPNNLVRMSISDRKSKVSVDDFGKICSPGSSFVDFYNSLPNILGAKDTRNVVQAVASARTHGRGVLLAMGAHVIKCGLGPLVADMIDRGIITSVAFNGACAIHDYEIACFGKTSEDVVEGMKDGSFGTAWETADFVNGCARDACENDIGLGESLSKGLLQLDCKHTDKSIMCACAKKNIPLTVHVALGSDIVHMHPGADGAAIGAASMCDFRVLVKNLERASCGGVLINLGSAVVLPETVLKAVTVCINQGVDMSDITGVNMDFIQAYRSNTQVVHRIRELGGTGYSLTGHHEIMVPLIFTAAKEMVGNDQ